MHVLATRQPRVPGRSRPRLLRLNDTASFAGALGSLVAGSSIRLGGAPGSRQSGLATQLAVDLALGGTLVLYLPTEEPAERVWERVGIHLLVTSDDIPEGSYSSLIKVLKYEAALEQAESISSRSTQGCQLALEQGRVTTRCHTPYGCHRLDLSAGDTPLFIIRDLRDGRQHKLDPDTRQVIDTYGQVGGGSKGHYRTQKQEKVLLVPGDASEIDTLRTIFDLHHRQGWGGKRIADHLNRRSIPAPKGRA